MKVHKEMFENIVRAHGHHIRQGAGAVATNRIAPGTANIAKDYLPADREWATSLGKC